MSAFATKLRLLRSRHATQADVAQALGVNRSHVTRMEAASQRQGRDGVSLVIAVRLARLFDVSCDYLLRETVPAEPLPPSRLLPLPGELNVLQFGAKLRYQRQRRGWSQRQLQEALSGDGAGESVTVPHLSQLEHGKSLPSIDLAIRFADCFALTLDYLLDDRVPVEVPPPGSGEA